MTGSDESYKPFNGKLCKKAKEFLLFFIFIPKAFGNV